MKSQLAMVDVGPKVATLRISLARGSLRMGREAFRLLRSGKLPKGDALKLGEAAGILAAKRAPELIPLCHPLPLEKIRVWFELDFRLPVVHAFCEVSAHAKTGVEMESLCGVWGSLLAVYDLAKQVDPAISMSDIRLEFKSGGKSGVWRHPRSQKPVPHLSFGHPLPLAGEGRVRGVKSKAAVLTVSDRCFYKKATDLSGPLLIRGLKAMGFKTKGPHVVPDVQEDISRLLLETAKNSDVVILTGGTGLSPRDVTPDVVESLCDRAIPGIGEALRSVGMGSTPTSSLSRSVAGQMGRTLVVALPGSPGGVRDGLNVLKKILPHAVHIARGGDHDRSDRGRSRGNG